MLSRLVFSSKSLWRASSGVQSSLAIRSMSHTRHEVNFNPPLLPAIDAENGQLYDPKTQTLEDFLNIRLGEDMPTIHDDKKPERDVKNFPRVLPPIWPDRTRLYLLPDSWFEYFYKKTGVTGPYVFGVTFGTYLLSKEWFIVEHEIFTGASLAILTAAICIKAGPALRKWGGEVQDAEVNLWNEWQDGMKSFLNNLVGVENEAQESARQHKILFDAKRENVKLQLEAEFRRRQMVAYSEVRNRLEYLLAKQVAERQYQQQHMVNWIIDGVAKGISATQEKDFLQKCLSDLKLLSSKHKISLT